jgi:hypothetical protein
MKGLFAILACSFSFLTFPQELWTTFPEELHAGLKIVSDSNGFTFHNPQINGFNGAEFQVKHGVISIIEDDITLQLTFDVVNPVKYNENSVYYMGSDENGIEYKIYFDSNTIAGKQQTLHLVGNDDSIRTTYYFNYIKGSL